MQSLSRYDRVISIGLVKSERLTQGEKAGPWCVIRAVRQVSRTNAIARLFGLNVNGEVALARSNR